MATTVNIEPVGTVTVVEGSNLTITCTDGVADGATVLLRENTVQLIGPVNTPSNIINGTARIFQLPVLRTMDNYTYDCLVGITGMVSAVITLNVTCEWN